MSRSLRDAGDAAEGRLAAKPGSDRWHRTENTMAGEQDPAILRALAAEGARSVTASWRSRRPRSARALQAILALLLFAASTQAGAFGFADKPSRPVDLGGSWQLNAPLSDDIPKRIAAYEDKVRAEIEKMRRRMPRQQGPSLYPTEDEV